MSDLADRISRAAVAALDLAPFDDRFGRLSRQVLAGGASGDSTGVVVRGVDSASIQRMPLLYNGNEFGRHGFGLAELVL